LFVRSTEDEYTEAFYKTTTWIENCTYQERLKRLKILSLELRRLHADLALTYKIIFGHVDIDVD